MATTVRSTLANNQAGLLVCTVTIAVNASLSSAFGAPGYCPVAIQTPAAMTTGTTALDLLAASTAAGTPVAALTSSGSQVSFAVSAAASQYVSCVGEDLVVAPVYKLQAVDANGAGKVQASGAISIDVVMRRFLS